MAPEYAECSEEEIYDHSMITYWFIALVVFYFGRRDLIRFINRPKPLNDATLQSIYAEARLGIRSVPNGKDTWVVHDLYDITATDIIIRTFKLIWSVLAEIIADIKFIYTYNTPWCYRVLDPYPYGEFPYHPRKNPQLLIQEPLICTYPRYN
ncbi:uncharacterized protein LOC112691629 [Sipha flava]|uniref:Uncharacterized protein LOC112691629 n=1 Tax=Sipha flava TaxID=143950 RepID=A0A8B8GGN0_9HEMI|nr:uncharacterized protein LOC112691629 [Sipha flava]